MLVFLLISTCIFAGLLMTRVTNIWHLPDVTAYLLVGVIIGPCCIGALNITGLGFNTFEQVNKLSALSDIALGFIAFAIGNEFVYSNMKKIGKQVVTIGIGQAVITTIIVDTILLIVHFINPKIMSVPEAITLGAIAAATAPAATIMVVRQYKAKGPVTEVLLPVVALDDAVGLVVFAVSFGIAEALISNVINISSLIINPIIEIISSLVLGAAGGYLLTYMEKYFKSRRNRLSLIIGFVILMISISQCKFPIGNVEISFSSLLVCMMMGTIFCNTCILSEELMEEADKWSTPFLILFFVLSGAELNFAVFKNPLVLGVGAVYIISRCLGKYYGAKISATIAGSVKTIRDYLGIALWPQAGVALGMSMIVATRIKENGELIRSIVLFGVLIYELLGPTLTKMALERAGEITEPSKEVLNRRENKIKEIQNRNKKKHLYALVDKFHKIADKMPFNKKGK